jgi:hypothetical protein
MDFVTSVQTAPTNIIQTGPIVYFIQQLLDFSQAYVMVVVLSLGIVGNTLSFVIFFRVRKRADACVQYLSCLAISDTGIILIVGVTDWIAFGLKHITNGLYDFNLLMYSSVSCKVVAGIWHIFEVISAWIIVAFSVERAYVVWFPLKRITITSRVRIIIIVIICVMGALGSVHRFILMDVLTGPLTLCFYEATPVISAVLWQLDIASYSYVPCTLIFLANILILVALSFSKNQALGENTRKNRSEGKLLVSLMSVSTLYVLLLLPLTTLFTYLADERNNLSEEQSQFLYYVMKFLNLVSMFNYCFNFVVYGFTLPFYRQEARRIFSINRRSVSAA